VKQIPICFYYQPPEIASQKGLTASDLRQSYAPDILRGLKIKMIWVFAMIFLNTHTTISRDGTD
jgi:hypothetical protein